MDVILLTKGIIKLKDTMPSYNITFCKDISEAYCYLDIQRSNIIVIYQYAPLHELNFIYDMKKKFKQLKIIFISSSIEFARYIHIYYEDTIDSIIHRKNIQNLSSVIRCTHGGMKVIDKCIYEGSLSNYSENIISRSDLEVITLLCRGKTNNLIAKELYLSEETVRNNISKILRKMNLNNRTEIVLYMTNLYKYSDSNDREIALL